jgi:hypothetical protein
MADRFAFEASKQAQQAPAKHQSIERNIQCCDATIMLDCERHSKTQHDAKGKQSQPHRGQTSFALDHQKDAAEHIDNNRSLRERKLPIRKLLVWKL